MLGMVPKLGADGMLAFFWGLLESKGHKIAQFEL